MFDKYLGPLRITSLENGSHMQKLESSYKIAMINHFQKKNNAVFILMMYYFPKKQCCIYSREWKDVLFDTEVSAFN